MIRHNVASDIGDSVSSAMALSRNTEEIHLAVLLGVTKFESGSWVPHGLIFE